ncbi:MAG: DUF2177 family protein [Gammaproteobacteria bacterium]|nr:DUF2177 family protein [Gammaproteobacteria bacterium]
MPLIVTFFISSVFMFILDMTWFAVFSRSLYARQIGPLLHKTNDLFAVNWPAMFVGYFMLLLGIFCFVLPKSNGNIYHALFWGGLFGACLFTYHNFVNLATLARWPLMISIVDVLWGIFLCSAISVFATVIQKFWFVN